MHSLMLQLTLGVVSPSLAMPVSAMWSVCMVCIRRLCSVVSCQRPLSTVCVVCAAEHVFDMSRAGRWLKSVNIFVFILKILLSPFCLYSVFEVIFLVSSSQRHLQALAIIIIIISITCISDHRFSNVVSFLKMSFKHIFVFLLILFFVFIFPVSQPRVTNSAATWCICA